MKPNLIYSVAFGVEYHFTLIREWVSSIRSNGYTDEIIILSDKDCEIPGATVKVCGFMTPGQLWKAALPKVVNCEDYNKILFLDSDIVFLQNPDLMFGEEGIRIPTEPLAVKMSGLNPVFLTQEELQTHGESRSFNAGTFLLPGSQAEGFLTAWETTWAAIDWKGQKDYWPDTQLYKGQMYDQGILEAMILRHQFPKPVYELKRGLIGFPCLNNEGIEASVALHLCGLSHNSYNKQALLDAMIAYRDKSKTLETSKGLLTRANPILALSHAFDKMSGTLIGFMEFYDAKITALEKRLSDHLDRAEISQNGDVVPQNRKFEEISQG